MTRIGDYGNVPSPRERELMARVAELLKELELTCVRLNESDARVAELEAELAARDTDHRMQLEPTASVCPALAQHPSLHPGQSCVCGWRPDVPRSSEAGPTCPWGPECCDGSEPRSETATPDRDMLVSCALILDGQDPVDPKMYAGLQYGARVLRDLAERLWPTETGGDATDSPSEVKE
jgi:hypothetical protein